MLFNRFLSCMVVMLSLSLNGNSEQVEKMVILGGGMAGLTSAIYAGQMQMAPLVVEGAANSGQTQAIYRIDNYPGFPEGISGQELAERTRLQAEIFGARFYQGSVVSIDTANYPFVLTFDDGQVCYAESIVVALGTTKKWLDIASEEALKNKGVSGSATADAAKFAGKEVVVVGGGDAALDEAIFLAKTSSKVTIIHRSREFHANESVKEQVLNHPKIEIIWDSAVQEILDPASSKVTGVVLRDVKNGALQTLACEAVFISIGRVPNTQMFKGQLETSQEGLLAVQAFSTQTNIPGVFAAGDISDPTYKKAITAAASGCMAAIDAIRFLSAKSQ